MTDDIESLSSAIADRVIVDACEKHVKIALAHSLFTALGFKLVKTHGGVIRPDWKERDRFLAPFDKRMKAMLRSLWREEKRAVLANMRRAPLPGKAAGTSGSRRKDKAEADASYIDQWLYPQSKYVETLTAKVVLILDPVVKASVLRAIDAYELNVAFDVVNERALNWLSTYAPKLSWAVEEETLATLRGHLIQGIDAGEGMDKLRKRVSQTFGDMEDWRAERIARTETSRANESGNREVWKEGGFQQKVWLANPDCCEELCKPLEGKVVEIDEPFFEDGYGDGMNPPRHPNCVLPGTLVKTPGGLIAGYRASYRGQAVQFTFSNGASLSVTPNHMLLTPNGFASAQLLKEGDDVFYCTDFKGKIPVNPNDDGEPSLIEEIVESLAKTRGMTTRAVPVAPEYLHGDGRFCDSNIDVIWPDGLLENGINPIMMKPFGAKELGATCPDTASLPGAGPPALLLHRMATAASGGMGGFRQPSAFFRGRVRHADNHGLMPAPGTDASFQEAVSDNIPANAETLSERLFGNAGLIEGNDSVNVQRDLLHVVSSPMRGAGDDASGAKVFLNETRTTPDVLGDLLKGQPGLIETTRIVKVEMFFWHGDVYDLQTNTSLYIANGILSSNCRCVSGPYDESWDR